MLLYERNGDIHFGAEIKVERISGNSTLITITGNREKVTITMHHDEAKMLLQSLESVVKDGMRTMGYVWAAQFANPVINKDTDADKAV